MQKLKFNITDGNTSNIFRFCTVILIFYFWILNLSGCAVKTNLPLEIAPLPQYGGITHIVKKGETLWGISRLYNLDLEKIVAANRISDSAAIKPGQNIFIPGAKKEAYTAGHEGNTGFIWPVKGKINAYFKSSKNHLLNKGIDITAKFGADILSARAGTVSFCADDFSGWGKTIIIGHDDGFFTVYAYNSQNLVKINDHVAQGAVIAKAGINPKEKEAMLHFQVRKGYAPQNPLYYLPQY